MTADNAPSIAQLLAGFGEDISVVMAAAVSYLLLAERDPRAPAFCEIVKERGHDRLTSAINNLSALASFIADDLGLDVSAAQEQAEAILSRFPGGR